MAVRLPQFLQLNIAVGPDVPMHYLWTFVQDTLVKRPGFAPDYWRTWVDRDAGPGLDAGMVKGAPPADAYAARGEANFARGFEVQGKAGGLMVQPLDIFEAEQTNESFGIAEGWRIFDFASGYRTPEAYFAVLAFQFDVLSAALSRFDVLRAELRRVSHSYLGPYPPLADPEVVAMLAMTDEVAMAYPDPDAYWGIWDKVEYVGEGRALCSRAMQLADETEYKARALRDGFALGHAARPGLAKYYAPDPSPAEEEVLAQMPRYLTQAGYDAEAQSMEFTAVPEPGEPLSPADIYDLLAYRDFGTADGDAVETIIVTFPDRATAETCAPPLRDIGARIQYFAPDGTWQILD